MFRWVVIACEFSSAVCEDCPRATDAVLEFFFALIHEVWILTASVQTFTTPVFDTVWLKFPKAHTEESSFCFHHQEYKKL